MTCEDGVDERHGDRGSSAIDRYQQLTVTACRPAATSRRARSTRRGRRDPRRRGAGLAARRASVAAIRSEGSGSIPVPPPVHPRRVRHEPARTVRDAIGWLLAVFYSVVPNLGLAIILLTCVVMALLLPLTAKQTRSMIAMQRVQPEIKKIQQQYKDDRQKQNEELMKFYQENNVNPLSGCLPPDRPDAGAVRPLPGAPDIQDHIPTTGAFNDLFRDLCGTRRRRARVHDPKDMYFLGWTSWCRPRTPAASRATSSSACRTSSRWPLSSRAAGTRCGRRSCARSAGLEPEQPDEQADADDQPGVPDRLRLVLLHRFVGPGAVLRDEQPLADRPAAPGAQQVLRGAPRPRWA